MEINSILSALIKKVSPDMIIISRAEYKRLKHNMRQREYYYRHKDDVPVSDTMDMFEVEK